MPGDRKDIGLGSGTHLLEVSIILKSNPVVGGRRVTYSWESHYFACLANGPLEQVPKKETISCEGETWVGWGLPVAESFFFPTDSGSI